MEGGLRRGRLGTEELSRGDLAKVPQQDNSFLLSSTVSVARVSVCVMIMSECRAACVHTYPGSSVQWLRWIACALLSGH